MDVNDLKGATNLELRRRRKKVTLYRMDNAWQSLSLYKSDHFYQNHLNEIHF